MLRKFISIDRILGANVLPPEHEHYDAQFRFKVPDQILMSVFEALVEEMKEASNLLDLKIPQLFELDFELVGLASYPQRVL